MGMFTSTDEFDGAAAITRSLLGYGVLAGVVYLIFGIVLGATTTGFDFARHPLSLLILGEHGWLQRLNLALSGAMVAAAALGVTRFAAAHRSLRWAGRWLFGYAGCLVASAMFAPDPMAGFPPGTTARSPSVSGLLHVAFGAGGFACVALAAVVIARWHRGHERRAPATRSFAAAGVIIGGFVGGAALARSVAGVVLLWGVVVTAWGWLARASIDLYRRVPHPLLRHRTPAGADH